MKSMPRRLAVPLVLAIIAVSQACATSAIGAIPLVGVVDTAAYVDSARVARLPVARQFLLIARHTRDPGTNLIYHACDADRKQPWADSATGRWCDVLDQPNRAGNYLEASASSMFAYALGKGARLGNLDAHYREIAERALGGIIANLVRENDNGTVSLINIVQVSGLGGAPRRDGSYRDGSYGYYISEPVVTDDYKGVGPFILAALELGR